jgi:multidrug efflux pump subunit AcrA (membrane-fusion protein)
MIGKYLLPSLAVLGFAVFISTAIQGNQTPSIVAPPFQAATAPYASYVAGAGMVESSTENIEIGTPVSGIVSAINVKWGDRVNAGDPLFKIDDRDLQGQLLVALAKVKEVEANLDKTKNLLRVAEGLKPGSSISEVEMTNRRFDTAINEAVLGSASAQVEQIKIEIERRTIRAPVSGRILQIKTRLGEFAPSGVLSTPLMLLGDDTRLHIRVDIDENDAWRVRSGAPATAFVRSNPDLKTSLQFERFEPYVVPKLSFTGESTERTDTRVLQAIYSFDPAALPIYVGQQMDVFIEALALDTTPQRTLENQH